MRERVGCPRGLDIVLTARRWRSRSKSWRRSGEHARVSCRTFAGISVMPAPRRVPARPRRRARRRAPRLQRRRRTRGHVPREPARGPHLEHHGQLHDTDGAELRARRRMAGRGRGGSCWFPRRPPVAAQFTTRRTRPPRRSNGSSAKVSTPSSSRSASTWRSTSWVRPRLRRSSNVTAPASTFAAGSIETDDPLETMFNRQSVPTSPWQQRRAPVREPGQRPGAVFGPHRRARAAKMER